MPKRHIIGLVTSDKMNKSRRVEIDRLVRHAKYGRYIRKKTVCHVHDEKNESQLGDVVEIVEAPPRAHLLEPVHRGQRAEQDGARHALTLADEVQAPVQPVRAIHVRVPRRAEHRGVPCGPAAIAVRRRVLVVVRLDLDDLAADAVHEQRHAEELRRDLVHRAGEEGAPDHVACAVFRAARAS